MKTKTGAKPVDHYSVNIAWSDEDEAFIARVPSMPGIHSFRHQSQHSHAC